MFFLIPLRREKVLYETSLWHRKIIITSYDKKGFYITKCKTWVILIPLAHSSIELCVIYIVSGFPEVLEIL